jgi:hypothetical protein
MVSHAMAEMLLLTEVVPLRMLNFDQLATAVSQLIPHLKSNASVGYSSAEFQVQRQVGCVTVLNGQLMLTIHVAVCPTSVSNP